MRRCWPGLEFDAAHDLPCIRIKSTTTSSSLNQNDFLNLGATHQGFDVAGTA